MTIVILIIAHVLYLGKILGNLVDYKSNGFVTGTLLTLVCWQQNTTWGIVTACYTALLFLIFQQRELKKQKI